MLLRKYLTSVAAPIVMLTLFSGCASTEDKGTPPESVSKSKPLSTTEMQNLLVGNTYPFSKGGIYFSSPTEATAMWDGKTEETEWYATDSSTFCYTLDLFGGSEECIGIVKTADGNYIQEFNGKEKVIKAASIKEGKAF